MEKDERERRGKKGERVEKGGGDKRQKKEDRADEILTRNVLRGRGKTH